MGSQWSKIQKNSIIGITTPFNVVAVTGSKNDLIPDDPTPIVDPDQSTEPANIPDGKKKGSKNWYDCGNCNCCDCDTCRCCNRNLFLH